MSETSGKVTGVLVNVGDYKKAGSVLFQVDDELRKAAYMSAEANYIKAKKDLERFGISTSRNPLPTRSTIWLNSPRLRQKRSI